MQLPEEETKLAIEMFFARTTLLLVVVAAFSACSGPPSGPSGPTGWNVLLVSVDTLRSDHLSCYGAREGRTPRMDELASSGVLFEDVTTVSPTTLPAHASLLTGRTPLRHGLRDNLGFYLSSDVPTLAAHLKSQGYETAGFVGAFVLDSRFGIAQGFDRWDDDLGGEADALEDGIVAQRSGTAVLASASRWLEERGADPRPFFAFVHFYDPHAPYEAEGDDDRARYRGEVAHVDALVGKLLDRLGELGHGGDTLVVLTSDHGEALGEHGERTHGLFLYEGTVRIPLLLRYPGSPKGKRVSGLARITDVTPTVVDLLGLPAMAALDGESLRARIEGPEAAGEEVAAYAETLLPRLEYGWSDLRSIRQGRYKLIQAPRPELYDIEADPSESRNLASAEPQRVHRLAQVLQERLRDEGRAEPAPIDAETRRGLESLGYTGAGGAEVTGDDPKDRLDLYLALNDTTFESLQPGDSGFEEALGRLRDVLRDAPSVPRAYVLYGDLLLRAGRAAEAEANFERLVLHHPDSFEGSYGLGVARARQGNESGARAALERALAIEPRNTKVHFQMSEIARAKGDWVSAERWLRDALALTPDRFLVGRLASVLVEEGKTAEARAVLTDEAERAPRDAAAAYQLGDFLLVQGDAPAAIPILRKALALDPDDANFHQALGSALASTGALEDAVASFQRAVALAPCLAQAHSNLGSAYAGLGRAAEAIESFERAVACDPSYSLGYKNLAAMELERGNVTAAVAAMRNAVRASPDDPELRKTLDQLLAYERARN